MARTPRTSAELHADSRTLLYEFDMLCGTAAQLADIARTGQRFAYNSAIESFAVHCRALIDFFFPPLNVSDTDVIATDFFPNPDQWLVSHKIDGFFKAVRVQANKQIAHMTTDRRNLNTSVGKDGNWQVSGIVQAICNLMADFLAAVPDQNLDPDAKQKLLELVRQHSRPPASPPVTQDTPNDSQTWYQGRPRKQLTDIRTIGSSITGKTCP